MPTITHNHQVKLTDSDFVILNGEHRSEESRLKRKIKRDSSLHPDFIVISLKNDK
jgi:hypothetical protein